MGRFIIFLGVMVIIALTGIIIWWVWNKIYIQIKRRNREFDIEDEAYKKIIEKMMTNQRENNYERFNNRLFRRWRRGKRRNRHGAGAFGRYCS